MKRIPVAVLGATGVVGQRFVQLLWDHPWFEVRVLAASDRSAGNRYATTVHWLLETPIPEEIGRMEVVTCDVAEPLPVVFSSLDSSVAGEIEASFAKRGSLVFSNAKNFRMESDVPLIVPEINADHLGLVSGQRQQRGWPGAIVTNPNCSTIVLALSLAPLHRQFGVEKVHVVTLQALSGAGYPGVSALDAQANVIPFISKEEEKIERETLKILGEIGEEKIEPAPFQISAQANRVPVENGHSICTSVKLREPATVEEVVACFQTFSGRPQELKLPSAPPQPVVLLTDRDRPQPKRDVNCLKGMAVTVGRVQPCPVLGYKFVALGHNTIRGAAGASILNAELAVQEGLVSD